MEKISIISYKHDGELHRVWKDVIKVHESKEEVIIVNEDVEVVDGDGHTWKTREPAVCFFYKKYWFNIICMLKGEKIVYYCNLSSPYVIDVEGLKYIDYDLDVKVFPNGDVLELDRDEYLHNQKVLRYSEKIRTIIEKNLAILISFIKECRVPFDNDSVIAWYKLYKQNLL